ncbi:MAG: cupredoxin domain-containing protein [Candidatus Acidiferrales bacterium]
MKKIAMYLAFSLLVMAALSLAQETPKPGEVREIPMTAKKYEYSPKEIRVKQGERVRLLITATDRKHGFQIKELGIKTELEKDKATAVEFVADKPGEYQFKCSVRCGFGHGGMRGTLIVEPAESKPMGEQ